MSLPPALAKELSEPPQRCVWFFANGYGDAVKARPAMAAANQAFEGHKALITQKGPHRFLFEGLGFDQIVELPMEVTATGRRFDAGDVAMKLSPCGLFISGVAWDSTSLRHLKHALRPKVTAGFYPEYDITPDMISLINWTHRLFALAQGCGAEGTLSDYQLPPLFSARASDRVDGFLRHLPAELKVLVLHFDTRPAKMWPWPNWHRLLSDVLARRPDFFALLVGIAEPPPMTIHQDRVISLVGMPLEESMYLVSKAHVFAGIDSCMLHVADICNVPAVGIFVDTSPADFGPCFTRNQVFSTSERTTDDIIEAAARFLVSA